MKKFFLFIAPLLLICACQPKGPSQEQYNALQAQYDSILTHATEVQDLLGAVSSSLDSISTQEGLLFVNNEDGSKVTKRQMLERIQAYKDLLTRQQEQLEALEKKNSSNKTAMAELKAIISRLRQEIQMKEDRIAELEEEITTKNQSIEHLQKKLEQSQSTNVAISQERDVLQQVAEAQDKMLNTGYYVVATKSMLKTMGLLKGVFKKKADYANMDRSYFREVDIRDFNDLVISCKAPKMITEKPADSYEFGENGDGTSTLKITNPNTFWAASPFLIIMTK